MIDALSVLLPDYNDINNWHLFKKLRPLVLICFDAINQYQIKTVNAANLLNNMAIFLKDAIGNYQQALPLFQKATEILRETSGIQSENYAASFNNLASLYKSMEENEKALPLYEESKEIWGETLEKKHPNYATSLNNLGLLYDSMGEYEKALPLYEESLKIKKEVLGTQHPDYAIVDFL